MIKSIRQLIEILDPSSRLHFALLIIPMLLMTLLEIASIGLVIPVIQVLILGKQDGQLTQYIMTALPIGPDDDLGLWVTGFFAVFFVLKNIFLLAMIYIVNRVVAYKTAVFAHTIFNVYLSRPMEFHFNNNSAGLLLNITTGIDRALETVRLTLLMVLDALLMVGAFVLLVYAEPVATLCAAFVLVAVGLSFFKVASPIFRFWGEITMKMEGSLIKWINQAFEGIRIVKLMQAQSYMNKKIEETVFQRAHYYCRSVTAIHIPRLMIEAIVVIGFLGIVLILISAEQRPVDVIGVLGLFGMAALRLMPSLNRLLTSATEIRRSAAFISQVHEALTTDDKAPPHAENYETLPHLPFESEVRVEGVIYTYPDSEHSALHEIDLVIAKGETVGIVGPSGGGKSTLMDIILGLLKPEQGRLTVDGEDVFENLPRWQRQIGFVPQQIFLMDDTLRRNVAFATRDEDIDEDQVQRVLQMARLDEFVGTLPDGLSTMLGERGSRLSGGQRQRIAIARALYRNPDVLVFDEATSALDNETDREIRRTIDSLSGEKTMLICAHRLNTVLHCNKIVFMKDGRIASVGPHDELVRKNADYARLCSLENFEKPA